MALFIISIVVVAIFLFVPFAMLSFLSRFIRARYEGWSKVMSGKTKVTKIKG